MQFNLRRSNVKMQFAVNVWEKVNKVVWVGPWIQQKGPFMGDVKTEIHTRIGNN